MKKLVLLLFTGIALAVSGQTYPVASKTINYTDAARGNRTVSLEFRYPGTAAAVAAGAFPFVIFAHGFQMDAAPYYPYADSLAKRGYIVGLLTTETSLSPSHPNFGKDLIFMYGKMKAENSNAASFFYQKVLPKGALGGHSMGGGSLILSAQDSVPADCYFTFSPSKATTPACIPVAYKLSKPYLAITGSGDCIAPAATDQRPIYDSARSVCKTYINITGGLHCQFGSGNFQCNFGEGVSGCASSSLSRASQINISLSYLIPFLDYYLKGNCAAWTLFENRYAANTTDQLAMSCNNQIPSNASISGDTFVCEFSTTTLTASPAGFSYFWNGQTGGPTYQATGEETDSLVVSNGTCSLPPVSFHVKQFSFPGFVSLINGPTSFCPNTSHVFSMAFSPLATNYTWTIPPGWAFLSDSSKNSVTIRCNDSSGTITARMNNVCFYSNTYSKDFTVLPATPGSIGTISGSQQICIDTTYTFQIPSNAAATSFVWSYPTNWVNVSANGLESIQLRPSQQAGNGPISVYSTNGCGNSDTATLQPSLHQPPVLSNLVADSVACLGSSIHVSVTETGNGPIIWSVPDFGIQSGDSTTSIHLFVNGAFGSHPITVYARNFCGASNLLFQNVNIVDLPSGFLSVQGDSMLVTGTGVTRYDWYLNGQLLPGVGGSGQKATASGVYEVLMFNEDSCSRWTNQVQYYINGMNGIAMPEISWYPNPANDQLNFRISDKEFHEVVISDVVGHIVLRQAVSADRPALQVDELAAGCYQIQCAGRNSKLIIERF